MASHSPISVAFHIRPNKNKHADYSVYACIKTCDFPPKELIVFKNISRDAWDLGHGRPKQNKDYLMKMSLFLDEVKARLFEIYFDLKKQGVELSPENIKAVYTGNKEFDYTILQLAEAAIEKYKTEVSPGTLKNYFATQRYLRAFCKKKYKIGDVSLKYMTSSFIDELKSFILNTPLKANDPCANNGCMKHMERIKKIMKWAYEMRYIDRDVSRSLKIHKTTFESQVLHIEQLNALENKRFYLPLLEKVKDLFVFSCYTGLAPIDIQRLSPHQIFTDPDGVTWLRYIRVKSKVAASIPLLEPAMQILKKYEIHKGKVSRATVFPFISNQVLNRSLKIISEILELGIELNFYIARYTFATTVLLMNGAPITSIKSMMGHKRFDSTLHYAKPDKYMISDDMKKVQERIDSKKT